MTDRKDHINNTKLGEQIYSIFVAIMIRFQELSSEVHSSQKSQAIKTMDIQPI